MVVIHAVAATFSSWFLSTYHPSSLFFDFSVTIFDPENLTQSDIKRFQSNYELTPFICSKIWTNLTDVLPEDSKPKHFLWCFRFLKAYGTESVAIRAEGNPTEKTYQKWVWRFI